MRTAGIASNDAPQLGIVAEGESRPGRPQLGGHRRRAAERDVLQVDAGPGLEHFGQRDARPSRCRSTADSPRPGVVLRQAPASGWRRQCESRPWRIGAQARRTTSTCGMSATPAPRILHRVVGAVLQQALVGGMGLVGAEDEGVAVGLRVRHRDAADHARAAAAIVHRDRLAERVADRMRDQPRRQSTRSAGRVGRPTKVMGRGPRARGSSGSAPDMVSGISRRTLHALLPRARHGDDAPSSAASKALAIASLLLPGFAASPITVTIWPGAARALEAVARWRCARGSRTSRAPSASRQQLRHARPAAGAEVEQRHRAAARARSG